MTPWALWRWERGWGLGAEWVLSTCCCPTLPRGTLEGSNFITLPLHPGSVCFPCCWLSDLGFLQPHKIKPGILYMPWKVAVKISGVCVCVCVCVCKPIDQSALLKGSWRPHESRAVLPTQPDFPGDPDGKGMLFTQLSFHTASSSSLPSGHHPHRGPHLVPWLLKPAPPCPWPNTFLPQC